MFLDLRDRRHVIFMGDSVTMKHYVYKNQIYNGKELAELTGVNYSTIMSRLANGYTVEEAVRDQQRVPESVIEFCLASHPPDWDGLTNDELYQIYCDWCNRNDFAPESNVHFTRCLKRNIPSIRIVPTRLKVFGEIKYKRVVRVIS